MLWLHGRGAHPAVCLSAPLPLRSGGKLEQKQSDCYVIRERLGAAPKQDQMQGSCRLLGLIEGGSVAPVEPLTGFTEAWQTGQFPLCTLNT